MIQLPHYLWEPTSQNHLTSRLKYRRIPTYLLCTILLPSPVHPTGFSFWFFPGFLAILPCYHRTTKNVRKLYGCDSLSAATERRLEMAVYKIYSFIIFDGCKQRSNFWKVRRVENFSGTWLNEIFYRKSSSEKQQQSDHERLAPLGIMRARLKNPLKSPVYHSTIVLKV